MGVRLIEAIVLRRRLSLAIIGVGAGALLLLGPGAIGRREPVANRTLAPDFELRDADGRTVRLGDYQGKVVLLNFWATWCGPCVIEVPWFIEFERRYKAQGLPWSAF